MRTYSVTTKELLRQLAATKGGSDLILTVGKPPQFRVHGEVVAVPNTTPLASDSADELTMSVLTEEQVKRFRKDKELDVSLHLEGIGRFRVNVFQQRGATGMVARIVMDEVPNFLELGLPPIIEELAKLRKGLLLFTGPTGHGKSTSVASVVDYINQNRACHIVCIEDPIEYVHRHGRSVVEQREVGIDTESFHAALRRVLRQAPDVIVIGEIRDRESAQVAMTLAETGHLIISTLHTSGAIASVNRLIDMFPSEQEKQMRSQLSASLAAVIWQQLIPAANKNRLVLACEVLIAIPAIRSLIRQGRIHEVQSLIQTGRKHGMFTMDQAIEELALAGQIDPQWFDDNYFEMPSAIKKNTPTEARRDL
jgi:twitching motility protein PilT